MTRQIKFRIFNYETESWRYMDLLSDTRMTLLDTDNLDSLSQFTDLYDCEGREVWEGDICQYVYKDRHGINFDGVAYIYWDTANCAFALDVIKDSHNDTKSKMSLFYAGGNLKLKIIGNRFENTELLGQDESTEGQDFER